MYQLIPDSDFEIYVNPETNELGTSIRGAARILEIPESTLRYKLKGAQDLDTQTIEIITPGGIQGARIIPANDLFLLSFEYNPGLAKRMGQAGASVYLAGLAGYEIKPQKKVELTRKEVLLLALKAEEEAEQAKAALAAAQPQIAIAEAVLKDTIALSMSDYQKTVKVNGVKLGRNKYYQLLREIKVFALGRPLPLQKWIDAGYFEVRDSGYSFEPVTWITPKGQSWLPGHIESKLAKFRT